MTEPPLKILVIKSKTSELQSVERFLEKIFLQYNISSEYFNKIYLCLSEAVTNAIVHGHGSNETKEIKVNVEYNNCNLSITVTDEGEGFDLTKVPDPTKRENLKKESGRGIHIIRSISDKVLYNDKGNSLHFKICCE